MAIIKYSYNISTNNSLLHNLLYNERTTMSIVHLQQSVTLHTEL